MFYVISQYWLWELLALALGAVIGWLTFTGEPGGWLAGWFKWALVAFAAGLLIALVHLIPGRPGHYLETALLLFACYIIGGHLGAWLRQKFGAPMQAATAGASASAPAAAFKPAVARAPHAAAPAAAAPVLDIASAARGDGAAAASAAGSPSAVAARPASAGSAAPAAAQTAVAARKPDGLDGAANGRADPLTRIRSITQADEARLNKAGIFHFDQIAAWDAAEAKWAGAQLGGTGRAEGENWVGQARGFAEAAGKSKVATATSTAQGGTAVAGLQVAAAAPAHPGTRPAAMIASGPSDNLKLIKGIGPGNEAVLNDLGTRRFGQIAGWDDANATWVGHHMAFPGRVGRELWVDQARLLSQGIQSDHALAVAGGRIAPSDAVLDDAAVAGLRAGHSGANPAARSAESPSAADAGSGSAASNPSAGAAAVHAAAQAARPAALDGAHFGHPDDLTQVPGIDARTAARLAKLGIFHFSQLAALAPAEQTWLDAELAAAGTPVESAAWTRQAAGFAAAQEKQARDAATAGPSGKGPAVATAAPAHPGTRPAAMIASGPSDNLKLIKGIGPGNEAVLNDLGTRRFGQIAGWDDANATWVGHHMAFPGRVGREHWVEQARLLAAGIETDHARDVRSGKIAIGDHADDPMDAAQIAQMQATMPKIAPKVEGEERHGGKRPLGLAEARGGTADDLKRIRGIGLQNEMRLHSLGIWHFDQIAAWTREQVQWVGSYLAFPGRIDREDWLAQAKLLAQGKDTAFSKRVDGGGVPESKS